MGKVAGMETPVRCGEDVEGLQGMEFLEGGGGEILQLPHGCKRLPDKNRREKKRGKQQHALLHCERVAKKERECVARRGLKLLYSRDPHH